MDSLSDRLKRSFEFNPHWLMDNINVADLDENERELILVGAQGEWFRLQPLFQAMIAAVKSIGEINEHVCDGGGDLSCSQTWFKDLADEALANIQRALHVFEMEGK